MLPQLYANPGWDPEVLKQAERRLAHVIGPVAGLMVRRAADATTDVDRLYRLLAETLDDGDRAAFLGAGAQPSRPKPSPDASQWDPQVLKQVEHQLGVHLVHVLHMEVQAGGGSIHCLAQVIGEALPQVRD